ncbi:MAG: DUF211 domain-containing protein [Candidatus Altiarchaeota archaeon]|nr:DUF211 domain-containing protein [Candidatus Altiarchaeota archaeon]
MAELRKLVLDVLKPHTPDIVTFAKELASLQGIDGVNISVYEIDKEVENVKITIVGKFAEVNPIRNIITDAGGTIHSIDEVAAGREVVEEDVTLHDRRH